MTKRTWDESNGDTDEQVDSQEDQLMCTSLRSIEWDHGKTLTLLAGR